MCASDFPGAGDVRHWNLQCGALFFGAEGAPVAVSGGEAVKEAKKKTAKCPCTLRAELVCPKIAFRFCFTVESVWPWTKDELVALVVVSYY